MNKNFIKNALLFLMALVVIFGYLIWKGERIKAEKELKPKIGQMLLVGFRGTEADGNSAVAKMIKDIQPGGVILFDIDVPSGRTFPRNIENPDQTKKLVSAVQSFSNAPLFIAADVEGGKVNRLKDKYGFIAFPGAQELGDKNNPDETKKTGTEIGQELRELGINMDLAPVVDVNVNPENPVIGSIGRSFSNDSGKVIENAGAFIDGLHENKIISALKHFPGHGSSMSDSHLGLTDITDTYQAEKELKPFEELIKNGRADMIMTAHIMNRNIDPDFPATLSPKFIADILRKELDFDGVVVSDDMQMGAIVQNFGESEALVRAINAGCDILIISNNGKEYDENAATKARDTILEAVQRGEIPKSRIDDSYRRIMELKRKYGLLK